MYHSVDVKKIFGVQKARWGGKKSYKGSPKNSVDLFIYLFIYDFFRREFLCGRQKNQPGTSNGNVTLLNISDVPNKHLLRSF